VVAYLMLKSRRNFIIIAFSSIIIFSITPKDSFLYNRLLYRFEINSEGLAGNNRVNNGFEYLYKDFHENGSIKDIMLGIGESQFYIKSANYNSSALSWKTFIVIDGYILFCLHALFFIYMGLRGGNKNTILFIIIYFASLYQRPFDFSLGYWLIFFAGILYSLNKEENTVDNKSLSRGNVNEEKSIVCN
ncbi:polymerase, partial [Bacillus thuringiensis]|nr:polymerase [Bacillus thuringiensis]